MDESGTAVFVCQSERAASSVVWRKGIAELRAGRKYEITQKGQVLQLAIKNLEKSDSDTYSCDIGDAQSRAKLTVQGMDERNVIYIPFLPRETCTGRAVSQQGSRAAEFWFCLSPDGRSTWPKIQECRAGHAEQFEAIASGVFWV